jgi:hypothetical protein
MQDLWLDHVKHRFPREFGNPARRLCTSKREYIKFIEGSELRDCYVTVYAFEADFAKLYPNEKLYDKAQLDSIYFDLDCELNLMKALADVKTILQALDGEPRVYFSGSKGFHVIPDFPGVKLKHPREALRKYCESMAESLGLVTADRRTFGDLARISRIPGTLNTKAKDRWGEPLWCIPLTRGEIFGAKNELDIIKLARQSPQNREIRSMPSDRIPEVLCEIDEEVGNIRLRPYLEQDPQIEFDGEYLSLPCIKLLCRLLLPKGARRLKAAKFLALAYWLDHKSMQGFESLAHCFALFQSKSGEPLRFGEVVGWKRGIERLEKRWSCGEIINYLRSCGLYPPCGGCEIGGS